MQATYRNGLGSQTLTNLGVSGTDGIQIFDGSTLNGGIVGSATGLDLLFTGSAYSAFTASFSNPAASVAVLPEPASITLAGLAIAGIGGSGAFRRRRKTNAAKEA